MGVQAELRLDPDTVEQRLARALPSAFCRTDDELGGKCPHPSPSGPATEPVVPDAVGTTAIVALVGPNQIVVANCGDSRAVLCRGGKALPLSLDHKVRLGGGGDGSGWLEGVAWNRVLGIVSVCCRMSPPVPSYTISHLGSREQKTKRCCVDLFCRFGVLS